MVHARLTHPTRGTLPFRQAQQDDSGIQAVTNVANELGVDRPALVHTETREGQREIRGTVTGRRRADQSGTDDWEQALADYVDLLESHVDEFQGDGYTLEDDQLGIERRGILESVEWSRTPGQPFDLEYQASFRVGRGTMGAEPIERRNPTVDTAMDVPLRVDGIDLPGFRDYQVSRSVGVEARPVYDRETAENNDIIMQEGVNWQFTFEGTHVGTTEERQSAHDALDALVATKEPVTLETRFPGYSIDGFVIGYEPVQQARFADNMDHYRLEFLYGTRA